MKKNCLENNVYSTELYFKVLVRSFNSMQLTNILLKPRRNQTSRTYRTDVEKRQHLFYILDVCCTNS